MKRHSRIYWLGALVLSALVTGALIRMVVIRAEDAAARESGESRATSLLPRFEIPGATSSKPNLVLISLDTLSARHLGLYGYSRNTSPNLDAYANGATVFLEAYSTAPKTAESHMSMFTSLYPSVHGVTTIFDENVANSLDDDTRTFAQVLTEHGYSTAGFHDGGFVGPQFGFGRGFDIYESGHQERATKWLTENADEGPFFLFYHTYWVHDPYCADPEQEVMFADPDYSGPIIHSREKLRELSENESWGAFHDAFWDRVSTEDPAEVAHVVALYDTLIAQLDESLLDLLDTIDRVAPNTVVIILSDHGEEFGQHGKFVHEQIYGETTHVPLIVRHPDVGHGLKVDQRVSLIDLAPTILDLLGIPSIEQFQGRSLARYLLGEREARPILIDFRDQRAWIDGDLKLIVTDDDHELYDLARDPGEVESLLPGGIRRSWDRFTGGEREDYRRLRADLLGIEAANAAKRRALNIRTEQAELDEDALDELRALGYIE